MHLLVAALALALSAVATAIPVDSANQGADYDYQVIFQDAITSALSAVRHAPAENIEFTTDTERVIIGDIKVNFRISDTQINAHTNRPEVWDKSRGTTMTYTQTITFKANAVADFVRNPLPYGIQIVKSVFVPDVETTVTLAVSHSIPAGFSVRLTEFRTGRSARLNEDGEEVEISTSGALVVGFPDGTSSEAQRLARNALTKRIQDLVQANVQETVDTLNHLL